MENKKKMFETLQTCASGAAFSIQPSVTSSAVACCGKLAVYTVHCTLCTLYSLYLIIGKIRTGDGIKIIGPYSTACTDIAS